MKLIVVSALFFLGVCASNDEELWTKFKQDQGKTYKSLREEKLRFEVFKSNLRTIEEHNAKYETGKESWFMGMNQFTDLTQEEFKVQYLRYKPLKESEANTRFVEQLNVSVLDEIDWRDEGAVLNVQDQGRCGSCWAFSAVGVLEGQNAIKYGIKTQLSTQELVDCAKDKYLNEGCSGGFMTYAFAYIRDHGISKLSDYPYVGKEQTCKGSRGTSHTRVTEIYAVKKTEQSLKEAVGTLGPIAVAINAEYLQSYAGGIYDNFHCKGDRAHLNHGVLAVGYGTEYYHDYWLVKNSWGASWGEGGYIRMTRNRFNQCGIATDASFATIA